MYMHYLEHVLSNDPLDDYYESLSEGIIFDEKKKRAQEQKARQARADNRCRLSTYHSHVLKNNERKFCSFVLALDGDMDFQPKAVELMLDYMKNDTSLGAVCGRIHPIGGGTATLLQLSPDTSSYILIF